MESHTPPLNEETEKNKKQIKKKIINELTKLNNTEKVERLKQLFQCRSNPEQIPDRHDCIMIKRGIFENRTTRITNNCRFYRHVEVDLDHMAEFCCNDFESCPHYLKFKENRNKLDEFQQPPDQ